MASDDQIAVYYSRLVSALGRAPDVDIVAIVHMVPNTLSFAPALNNLATLTAILPKPKSIHRPEYESLSATFRALKLSREWAADGTQVVRTLRDECGLGTRPFVLVDIGGYFSESANYISKAFGQHFLGVLEGTENGYQRYEDDAKRLGAYQVPIATVARSPLKLPEDYLVAESIVFSIEATLRQGAEILQTRSACVIGYGRVGSAVAQILRGRGISTVIFDKDPIKKAEAAARGFKVHRTRQEALEHASLVVCATGKKSLDLRGFGALQRGCVVASSTSSDDEFDLASLVAGYQKRSVSERLTRYTEDRDGHRGRHFFLIADGNAANFLDGAVIGPAMQLIEGEKLAAIRALIDRRLCAGIAELDRTDRVAVAELWNEHFL